MIPRLRAALAAALLALSAAPSASAQSDILLRLRSGSPLGDRMRVDSAGGVVARGSLGIGIIPQSGAGERMMWYPFKAAFRAGGVDGAQWDDVNTGFYSIASGFNVTAKGTYSVAMGNASQALQQHGVALGNTTNSDGQGAVAIGFRATADSDYGLALGYRASTNGFDGAMVISDASTTDSVQASANNQFSLRAAGGIRLYTNATRTTGMTMAAGGSSWAAVSDRNRKQDFAPVDGEDLLVRLRAVPVTTWRYREEVDRTTLHIGPMAQDWHAAFGFTTDDQTINLSDFDGVNLAAIQALEARTLALRASDAELRSATAELRARTAQVERLQAELDATRRRLAALEEAVRRMREERR